MHVVVGICTWNRAELLKRTLRSLERLVIPSGTSWEVLVVDNHSTDHTAEVVAGFRKRLPIARLFVPTQGKSHALNAAIDTMQGDVVLWTDDDVEVVTHWLETYVVAARDNPQADFFGGPIEAAFLERPPEWIFDCWKTLHSIYGERELGDETFVMETNTLPYGANWAVRLDVQKLYRFDQRLGRAGELMLAGEETDLGLRMLRDGVIGLWTPAARVAHFVTPERMTLEFIERYFFGCGASMLPNPQDSAFAKNRRAIHAWWHALRYECRVGIGRRDGIPTPRAMHCLSRAALQWGRLHALRDTGIAACLPNRIVRHLSNRAQPRITSDEVKTMSKETHWTISLESYRSSLSPRAARRKAA